jgi:hypothetical protein
MFLEEKLDRLKKEFYPEDLVIRFNDSTAVLKKVDELFMGRQDLNHLHLNWCNRMKGFDASELKTNLGELLASRLQKGKKYWWIFMEQPEYSGSRLLLFDATLKAGKQLSHLFPTSPIFVVDKKYKWLLFIDTDLQIVKEKRNN